MGNYCIKRSTSEESIFDEQILIISKNENIVENMWLNGQIIKAIDLEKFHKQKQPIIAMFLILILMILHLNFFKIVQFFQAIPYFILIKILNHLKSQR